MVEWKRQQIYLHFVKLLNTNAGGLKHDGNFLSNFRGMANYEKEKKTPDWAYNICMTELSTSNIRARDCGIEVLLSEC